MVPSEEITKLDATENGLAPELTGPVHINVTNPRSSSNSARESATEVHAANLEAVYAQREKTDSRCSPHHTRISVGATRGRT